MNNLKRLFSQLTNISVKNLFELQLHPAAVAGCDFSDADSVLCPSLTHHYGCCTLTMFLKHNNRVHRIEFFLEKLQCPLLQLMELKDNGFRVQALPSFNPR